MTQSLVINGKEYLPSNVLASRFGYTTDYIGKLAREEKILGTLIGRSWFVEPESLRIFSTQAEIAKKIRQDELRVKRKIERQAHEDQLKQSAQQLIHKEFTALASSAVVVLCGVLLGTLGWIAMEEDLGLAQLKRGTTESIAFISRSIVPEYPLSPMGSGDQVAASAEGFLTGSTQDTELIFTTLPEFPIRENIYASTTLDLHETFSDEVQVTENDDGTTMIVPVWREGQGVQQFLIVPVNAVDQ